MDTNMINGFANGTATGPPPSTLAAQIVENIQHSRPRRQKATEPGSDDLHNLLAEFLEAGSGAFAGTDLPTRFQLVDVLLKACAQSLDSVGPFDDVATVNRQAVQVLEVVESTIKQSPDLLLYTGDADSSQPFFLELLPRLCHFIGNRYDMSILDAGYTAIQACINGETRPGFTRSVVRPVTRYIDHIIADILRCFSRSNSSQEVQVPSHETLAIVWPNADVLRVPKLRLAEHRWPWLASISVRLVSLLTPIDESSRRLAPRMLLKLADHTASLMQTLRLRNAGFRELPELTTLFAELLSIARQLLHVPSQRSLSEETTSIAVSALCAAIQHVLRFGAPLLDSRCSAEVCWCLHDLFYFYKSSTSHSCKIFDNFSTHFQGLLDEPGDWTTTSADLRLTFVLVCSICLERETEPVNAYLDQLQDLKLRASLANLVSESSFGTKIVQPPDSRPRKRLRLTQPSPKQSEDARQILRDALAEKQIYLSVHHTPTPEIWKLLEGCTEETLSRLLNLMASAVCQVSEKPCQTCEHGANVRFKLSAEDQTYLDHLFDILTSMATVSVDQAPSELIIRTPLLRVLAMKVLDRLLAHTTCLKHFDLRKSLLGQWCRTSLSSRHREVRIVASKTLRRYVSYSKDPEIVRTNRLDGLDAIRHLAEKNVIQDHETCIWTLGQLADLDVGYDEMNIILFRLVDYLGHASPLLSGLAYCEILRLSNHEAARAKALLEPYWSSIAVKVVGDLHTKPSAVQRLCDILNTPVASFISFTRALTIPYLVLTKKRDVLERIASATIQPDHGPCTVAQICMAGSQFPIVLARILLEPSSDHASLMHGLLHHASAEFESHDIFETVKVFQVQIASEVFRRAGELGFDAKDQARDAINFVADHGPVRQGSAVRRSSRRSETAEDYMKKFFELNSLAIVKYLTDVVTQVEGTKLLPDRRHCLIGIGQMVSIATDSMASALPQITSCLRSVITNTQLCDDAFAVWVIIMKSVKDIGSLVDPTFALIERHWSLFNPSSQQKAEQLLAWLFREQQALMQEMIAAVPSLGDIQLLSKYEADIVKFKRQLDQKTSFELFGDRLQSEDPSVTLRALEELEIYLEDNAGYLQQLSQTEQPAPVVGRFMAVLLDTCSRLANSDQDIARRCARCLGLIGCLDPSRVELTRETHEIVVLSNFADKAETLDFIVFFLERIVVPTFLSNNNTRSQNFLGFAMQELLQICDFKLVLSARDKSEMDEYRRWTGIPESVRSVLTPFMDSKYTLREGPVGSAKEYPIFRVGKSHDDWLRELVYDLLGKAQGNNAHAVFSICKRIVRGQDISIASFLFPYVVLNILIGDNVNCRADLGADLFQVLATPMSDKSQIEKDSIMSCSQDVFRTLDYLSKWTGMKKRYLARHRLSQSERQDTEHSIQVVQTLVSGTTAETMASRALECRNYSRALFYWEQHIRQWRAENAEQLREKPQAADHLYERLQEMYVSIDEPDGIEGASAYLQLLDINQQVMEHRKAGRWSAVQYWSEMQLVENPDDEDNLRTQLQTQLLSSLKESGQFDVLLKEFAAMDITNNASTICRPMAIEACWATSNWEKLGSFVSEDLGPTGRDFTEGVGALLQALNRRDYDSFESTIESIRIELARGLSAAKTNNLISCRQTLLQLHALCEVEAIADVRSIAEEPSPALLSSLNTRLDTIGAFASDKQYILGLRRAAMELSKLGFGDFDISAAWLSSARLFRKQGATPQAFRAILHATQLDDQTATIEHARLLWKEGSHRKAIQSLEGAIAAQAFEQHATSTSFEDNSVARTGIPGKRQNILEAKAKLMLARWTDQAGQTRSDAIIQQYQAACTLHARWEKGQYCLGRHYDKLLESEKTKPPQKMAQTVLTGELAKHVIENYNRGMAWGAKYVFQSLPRCLTLWCEMGNVVDQPPDSKYGTDEVFRKHIVKHRKEMFEKTLAQFKKYIDRLPAWIYYTALNQVCARICHPHTKVHQTLMDIVVKVCTTHPQQALWALLAMVRSTQKDRQTRGQQCIAKVQDFAKKSKNESIAPDIKILLAQGTKMTEQLLNVCEADLKKFHRRQNVVSLKDMGFIHKAASPCKLVVPVQANLTLSLPPVADAVSTRSHKAFSRDVVTVYAFLDDTLLLNSLQRPRKVDIRGTDGRLYGILCKPKDDLRLDQRLMEFNAMIQRSLKRDAESSKRRLYVKTYAVTPLNEECGLIEWVDGLKTHRDILLKLYQSHGISPEYRDVGILLEEALRGDLSKFTKDIANMFPNVFHEWFAETFPEPEAWYTARLRYTRSCAVMSVVGHALGLGDRHSENIMIEEGNGGIMHVDFNCLFDKGLTFEKPEKVPFRLTSNMVDAFGSYGYEGPFRKACELTLGILRQNEDMFMTILEQFLHDPTIDLMGTRKKRAHADVPNTPEGVLESVRNKLRGLLPKESIPLSVEGYTEHLIQQARDPVNLASMYIGWCAFL